MAARPRKKEYRHLPDYLFFDKDRGVYKFTLITGKKKTLGSDRVMAIAIAREYNLRMRPENTPSIDSLIRESGGLNGEAHPFSEHVDRIMERAIKDEQPSKSTLDDWNNDAIRVKEFFNNIPACDIELEHVNAYIRLTYLCIVSTLFQAFCTVKFRITVIRITRYIAGIVYVIGIC